MSTNLDAVQPQPLNPWGLWATLGFTLLIMSLMLGVSLVVVLIAIIQALRSNPGADLYSLAIALETNGDLLATATLVANTAATALIYLCVQLRKGATVKSYLYFYAASFKTYLIWNGLLLLFLVFSEALSRALNHSEPFMEELFKSTSHPILLFLAVVVAAPVFEELLFRGFMLPGLVQSPLGLPGAILLTSAIWASIHLQYGWFTILIIFAMGLLLGYAHLKTRSIYIPISMHAVNNLLAFVLTARGLQ